MKQTMFFYKENQFRSYTSSFKSKSIHVYKKRRQLLKTT